MCSIICNHVSSWWLSINACKYPEFEKNRIVTIACRKMYFLRAWNISPLRVRSNKIKANYFLVATSQVRTSSSIKSSFSFHCPESAFVPQQERWFLRSSRFALCNNPIEAFIWWATSAQYTSSSIIFWTLASVPIAFLILSCILSFESIIMKIILKNPMISVYSNYFLAKVPPASAGFYVQFSCSMFHHRKNKSCKYMDCMCIYL